MIVWLSLACILLGSFVIYLFSQYPGYLLIHVASTTIEMSIWLGVIILAASIFVCWLLIRLWKIFTGRLKGFKSRRTEKKEHAGLLHFVEGDLLTAKKELTSASKDKRAEKSYLNSLIAARSALDLGQINDSEALLNEAEQLAPPNTLAVIIGKVRLMFVRKEYAHAQALLDNLSSKEKKRPAVLDLLRQLYIQQKNWPGLITLLPALKSSSLYKDAGFDVLEENAYMSYLDGVVQSPSTIETKESAAIVDQDSVVDNLKKAWTDLPKHIKRNPRLVGLYCSLLHRLHQDELAEILIRKSLKDQWHSGLVELYGKLNINDNKSQLANAESWLKQHENDAHLLFALGRLSIRNSLWGKAKDYLSKSLTLLERPEVYAEFGALLEKLGEHKKSVDIYRRGLMVASAQK